MGTSVMKRNLWLSLWLRTALAVAVVAVVLATVIVMTTPPLLIVMVVGLATGVVSWLTTLVEPARTVEAGVKLPVPIAVVAAV